MLTVFTTKRNNNCEETDVLTDAKVVIAVQ